MEVVIVCQRILYFVLSTLHAMVCTNVAFEKGTRHGGVSGPKFLAVARELIGGGVVSMLGRPPSVRSCESVLVTPHRDAFAVEDMYVWIMAEIIACYEGDLEIVHYYFTSCCCRLSRSR